MHFAGVGVESCMVSAVHLAILQKDMLSTFVLLLAKGLVDGDDSPNNFSWSQSAKADNPRIEGREVSPIRSGCTVLSDDTLENAGTFDQQRVFSSCPV